MSKRKRIEISLLFGLLFALALCFAGFDAECDLLRRGVFRLRVIADSDSEADQRLKLKVRDEILKITADDFAGCSGVDEAEKTAKANLDRIAAAAQKVIEDNGFCYSCTARVGRENFGNCEYDDFTLPAGEYKALIITLGSGKGHNWWCVLFPGVCLPSAAQKQSLESVFDNGTAEIAYNPQEYICRFKAVEIYEKIKEKCKKRKKV